MNDLVVQTLLDNARRHRLLAAAVAVHGNQSLEQSALDASVKVVFELEWRIEEQMKRDTP